MAQKYPIGLDILGAAHPKFKMVEVLKGVPRGTPLGFFWDTFGPMDKKFVRLISMGFKVFRIQAYWSDDHTLVPLDRLQKTLENIKRVADPYKDNIVLYVSPSCEHNETNKAKVRATLALVKRIIPYAIPVNTPYKGAVTSVYLNEKHGSAPHTCHMVSTDGTNVYDIDAAKFVERYKSKELCFLWGSRFNLRQITKPGQKPPPIPARTAAPDAKYVQSVLRLGQLKGVAPKPAFEYVPFEAPNIFKTHAEDSQGTEDVRNNKPVILLNTNAGQVDLIDHKGKVVCTFPRYGSPTNGVSRYYSGRGPNLYGYEIANKAKRQSGSEFVWIKAGNNVYGPVNPAFREGTFRD